MSYVYIYVRSEERETYEIRDDTAVGDSAGGMVEVRHAIRPVRSWTSEGSIAVLVIARIKERISQHKQSLLGWPWW